MHPIQDLFLERFSYELQIDMHLICTPMLAKFYSCKKWVLHKAKVTHTARVHFSIGTYHDYADCDIVPMQACYLFWHHPWEFDTNVVYHGRANKCTLMHKGKKITLLPLTPNEIIQCDRAVAETAKREYEIQYDQIAPPSCSNAIQLKSHTMLAIRSDLFVPTTVDAHFHALVCRQVLFLLDDITTPLPQRYH
jgi:hypothetical protein